MDNLATVVESMINANRALRGVIESSAEERSQLEKFEDHFRSAEERFFQFKQTVFNNNHQADELILRLKQSLIEKQRTIEEVKGQIASLENERRLQDEENERLEKALDDNVDSLKTISIAGGNLLSACTSGPPKGEFIDRLFEDMSK